jgi:Leucine-rich repeat (LRR) protein
MTLHPAIQSLTLQQNSLEEVGSASFQFHPELSLVDLAWNRLSSIQDRTFEAQTKLAYLRLAHNRLTRVDNNTFYGLVSLRVLDLAGNQLTRLPANLLVHVPALEELYLAENKIQALESGIFSGLCCLRKLSLARNELAGFQLGHLARLEELDLSGDRLTSLQLGELPLLATLDLSGNSLLANISSRSLSALPSLTSLNLSRLSLSHIPLGLFLHTRGLKQLFLNGNSFTAVPPSAFIELTQLQELELSDIPELEEVSSSGFLGLGQLTSLHMARNRKLSRLEAGVLEPLHSLRLLNLEQNSLVSLEVRPGRLLGLDLRLGGNPWFCNCSLRDLQESLRRPEAAASSSSPVICSEPSSLAGLSLQSADLSDCPVSRRPSASVTDHEVTVVIVLSLVLVLLLALAGVLLFRCRRSLQRLLKRLRWGKHGGGSGGGPEGKLSGAYGKDYQQSFIQHEEYFLSLARQQAEYSSSGANVPVTEL